MKKKEIFLNQNSIKSIDSITKKREFNKTIIKCYSNNRNSLINNKSHSTRILSIIFKNLKKYSTTKLKYNTYIINSIIFDQKNHIVAEFKNYLLWDESSEFLKRFYHQIESFDRLPSITQYYETYTLFAPKYFGLEGPLILIMNEWTKKKRKYLEYLEDKEDKKKNKDNYHYNYNFKNIINTNLTFSETKSKHSKKTLELTKYENVDSFFIKENNDLDLIENNQKNNLSHKTDISLSKIMEDLSSNYSIFISNNCGLKKNEDNKSKNNFNKKPRISCKNKINKKNHNINYSDKVLFSFTNLYKNRNKKITGKIYSKKYHYGTTNNSISKNKKSYIYEKNKENKKDIKDKNKIQINIHLNDINNKIKNKFKSQNNNLQITMNNFTRNKTSLKDKKDNIKKHALTNTNAYTNTNTNINNLTSYNNSPNNSLSKNKIRNEKIKKLYLRNLKIFIQSSNFNIQKVNRPISNTIDKNQNENNNINNKKINCVKMLTCKNGKYKNYLLNGNIINFKNVNSYRYIKPNNNQNSYEPSNKINKLIKEKRIITNTNSFSNNKQKNNNSKNANKKIKNNIRNFILLNKKMSNRNLIRNLVLSQFHSRKEIMNKRNKQFNNNNIKNILSQTKNMTSRNSASLKTGKRFSFNEKTKKRLNESLNIIHNKKDLNKINLNFNFNINFNIDVNKKKKNLLSHKNNLGFITQRNPISKLYNNINLNKYKSKDGESSIKKNTIFLLLKNMKKDYNLGLKKVYN